MMEIQKTFSNPLKFGLKVQDLHEEFLLLQKTLQALLWVGFLWVCVYMYVILYCFQEHLHCHQC